MLFLGKFNEGIASGIRVVLLSSKNFNKSSSSSSSSSSRSRSRSRSSSSSVSSNITEIAIFSLA